MFGHFRHLKAGFDELRKRRALEEARDRLCAVYEKDILNAKNSEERERLESTRQFECSEYDDELARMDSLELVARGRQFHLDISDLPVPPGDLSHWTRGAFGTSYIQPKSLREFAKLVDSAEYDYKKRKREGWDFWLKVYTAIAASVGGVAGILSLFAHTASKK